MIMRSSFVADTVFYIQRGKVKLAVVSEQGKEAVVAILEPGQFHHRPPSATIGDRESVNRTARRVESYERL
jgi:CRP-like cAMP-binding protein